MNGEWGMRGGDGAIYGFVWCSLVCPSLAWHFVYLFICFCVGGF